MWLNITSTKLEIKKSTEQDNKQLKLNKKSHINSMTQNFSSL